MSIARQAGGIALVMVAAAGTIGITGQTAPAFDVVSVRVNESSERPRSRVNAVPQTGRLTITGMTVQELIQSAYSVQPFELIANGSPVLKQRVDVVAKAPGPATVAEMQRMLQPMLEQRFKLAVHREMREMDALLMVRTGERLGPKINTSAFDCRGLGTTTVFAMNVATPEAPKDQPCGFMPADGPGRIIGNGIEMTTLAGNLAVSLGRPVLDMTRLEGRYDIDMTYTPDAFSAAGLARRGASAFPGVDPNGPPLPTALAGQLGLKLESRRAPVSVLVIDRLESLIPD
jgi:uncharacterized protein (TIGR03435 family)